MARLERQDLLPLATALLLAVIGRLFVGIMTSDDAYITFRYALNLATHHQLVFNLGERVLGTSTPLFALVLAGVASVGLPLESTTFAISIACDLATIVVLFLLLAAAGQRTATRIAVAPLAVLPAFLTSTVRGMEAPLYTLLILLAARALPEDGRRTTGTAAGILIGLTTTCRPEGGLLAAVAIAVVVASGRWRLAARIAVVALATAAPWLVFATWYFGSPLPQSVVAKAAGGAQWLDGIRTLRQLLLGGAYIALTPLALIGGWTLWTTLAAWRVLIAWWLVYTAAFTVTGAFARAEWYFTPLLPVYFGCAATGAMRILALRGLEAWRVPAAVALGAALTLLPIRHWAQHRAALQHVREIRELRYMTIAREIARSPRPCAIAAGEIGALGFSFPGRIIDLVGLVTPSAVRMPPMDLLEQERAQWLVQQNIYMPASLTANPAFIRTFRRVSSTGLEPGRTVDVYERVSDACAAAPPR
jgi:hypothetical protein